MNQSEMLNWVHYRTSSRRSANLTALEQVPAVSDTLGHGAISNLTQPSGKLFASNKDSAT